MDSIYSQMVVRNKMGIHARSAAMIVRLTSQYPDVSIRFSNGSENANGKSIMEILMLAAGEGTQLNVEASGVNATTLIQALKELFEGNFQEA